MIQISKGEIFYCGYFITDLKTPFIKLSKQPQYIKSPSETIFSKQASYYTFEYNKNWYRLIRKTLGGFKYHAIYKTDTTIKRGMRHIVLNECLDNKETRWRMTNYLQKIIDVLVKSYPFTLLITDFQINFDTGIKHIYGNWNIINAHKTPIYKKNKIYLGDNDNKISISNCGKELAYIDPKNYTNIDLSVIKGHENIIILSKTNGFYSSYIANYLYSTTKVKQILPVTAFLI